MTSEIKCPKCNGAMAEGFILDHGDYDYKPTTNLGRRSARTVVLVWDKGIWQNSF